MVDYDNANSLGSKFRQKQILPLQDMISQVFREKGSVRILHVGGTEYHWTVFPQDFLSTNRVQIVLINFAGAINPVRHPDIYEPAEGNGCGLSYNKGNEFAISHSNYAIEHVGSWDRKVAFANEVSRVAPRYWHQTPNFWFPWEPHYGLLFYHWLPEPRATYCL